MTRQMADDEVLRVLGYAPGPLDESAPQRVWLQIDTFGDNDERGELWPGSEHVTWQDESIGGLEIVYVRADLHAALQAERDALRAEVGKLQEVVTKFRDEPPVMLAAAVGSVLTKRAERAESALEALRGQVAGLVEKWRTRMPANAPDTSRVLMREWCADQLAELLAIKERMG